MTPLGGTGGQPNSNLHRSYLHSHHTTTGHSHTSHHMSRGRSYVFTWNNPTLLPPLFIDRLLEKADGSLDCIIFQEEKGELGTPHYQGMLEFRNPRYFNAIKDWVPWHLERRKGTKYQAFSYCTKEESRIAGPYYWPSEAYCTEATKDKQGKRTDLEDLLKLRREGASEEKMLDAHPGSYVRYRNSIEAAVQRVERPVAADGVRVIVLWGDSGSGKSHDAFRPYLAGQDAYLKDSTHWWDGYAGQKVIILDEFYDSDVPIKKFLVWCDKWPHREQVKGGYVTPGYHTVVLTSNQDPVTWYPNSPSYHAVQRRITDVVHYTGQHPLSNRRVVLGDPSSADYFLGHW